uniref:Expressed conserved protein n=1 Tax=Ascaris lumbricoides TaxID=6252 RepID=A0A0M3IRE2_ASCLU
MKAELIGPKKSVQRSDSDSSSSRSTSSRSSKRKSHCDLLLSSPRRRRQQSEHRYLITTALQADRLRAGHRSVNPTAIFCSHRLGDEGNNPSIDMTWTISKQQHPLMLEVTMNTRIDHTGRRPRAKTDKKKLIATTPKLITDHQHKSSRSHCSHRPNRSRSRRDEDDSSRSSTSSRSRRKFSRHNSRRDLLLTSPKKRKHLLSAQKKSERGSKATTPPYAIDHHQSSKRRRHSHLSHSHRSHKPIQKTSLRRSTHRSKRGKGSLDYYFRMWNDSTPP